MAEKNSATFDIVVNVDKLSKPNASVNMFETELMSLLEEAAVCVEKYLEAYKNSESEEVVCTAESCLKSALGTMHVRVGEIKNKSLLPEVFEYLANSNKVTRIMKSFCDFIRET